MEKKLLSIQEAAKLLRVSTKTLRRWEARGVLLPQRTAGAHRRYTTESIEAFSARLAEAKQKKVEDKPAIDEKPLNLTQQLATAEIVSSHLASNTTGLINPKLSVAKRIIIFSSVVTLFTLIFFVGFIKANLSDVKESKVSGMSVAALNEAAGDVLAAETASRSFSLKINLPTTFSQDAAFLQNVTITGLTTANGGIITNNADVNAGTGELTASNVIYSVNPGTGIAISAGQNPIITNTGVVSIGGQSGAVSLTAGSGISISGNTITNTAQASSANGFGKIIVGSDTVTAGGPDSTFTLEAGSGISLGANTSNNTITITSSAVGGVSSLNTLTGDLDILGGGINTISVGANSITVTGTEADTLATVTSRGASTAIQVALDGGLTSTAANAISLSSTAPIFSFGDTGTLSFTDGTNNLLTILDQGTTGKLTSGNASFTDLISGTGSALCLDVSNNLVTCTTGSGGISGNGTTNRIPKFSTPTSIADGSINDLYSGGVGITIDASGQLGVGTTTPTALLDIAGTASVSGAFKLYGTSQIQSTDNKTLTIGGDTTGNIALSPNNGSGILSLNVGGILVNGIQGITDGSPQCVTTTNGIVTGTGTCQLGSEQWIVANGVIYPGITSLDLLVGGASTASAKFAFINNAGSGTPTASISANSGNNATYLTGAGTLGTVNKQTLTLGSLSTGNISLFGFGAGIVHSNANGVLSSSALNLAGGATEVIGLLPTINGGLGADVTAAGAGELLYSTSTNAYGHLTAGGAGQCLTSGGAGAPVWASCAGATGLTNYWNQLNGSLYPNNSTVDFLIGGQSSASAKFAILNVNSGTPTASVSAGLSGGAFLTAAGNLGTTNEQTLTLGSVDTGNIVLSGFGAGVVQTNASGVLSSSALNLAGGASYITGILPTANGGTGLDGSGAANGQLLIGNGTGYTLATLTAGTGISVTNGSGSIEIDNTGVLSVQGGTSGGAISGALTLANSTTAGSTITIDNAAADGTTKGIAAFNATNFSAASGVINTIQNIDISATPTFAGLTLSGFTGNNASLYGTSGTGQIASATTNTAGLCLVSGASAPTWVSCAGSTGLTTYWTQNNGSLFPNNSTVDFLIGGQSSASAKFAVLNVNSGTPTASVSAGAAGGAFLTAAGNLATTNEQTLTLGSADTGNIVLSGFGAGAVQTNANGVLSSGTLPVANGGTGATSFTANGILFGNTTGALQVTAAANNAALITNGSGVPSLTTAGTNQVLRSDGSGALAFGSIDLSQANTVGVSLLGTANGGLGANITAAGAGELLYSTGATTYGHLAAGGSGQCLTSGGVGAPVWTSCGAASGDDWDVAGGAIYPKLASTLDFLLGSSATASAQFAVTGISNGTPTATISATTNGLGLSLTGNTSTIQSLRNATLTLGGNSTGSIALTPLGGAGTLALNVGSLTINGTPGITSAATNCVTTVNGIVTGTGPCQAGTDQWAIANGLIYSGNTTLDFAIGGNSSASAKFAVLNVSSGTPTASVSAGTAGASYLTATGLLGTTNMQSLTLGNSSTGQLVLGNTGFGVSTGNNAVLYGGAGTGVLSSATTNTTGLCLVSGGSVPSWTNCAGAAGVVNYWQLNNNAVSPANSTFDVLFGATATSSAKFGFLNNAGGTPVASISANNGNNTTYLSGDGVLATTNKQTLTLGSSSTGNVVVFGLGTGVVHSTGGVLSTSAVTNAELQNSSITINTGIGLTGGAAVSLGGALTLDNTGVLSVQGGTSGAAISGALTLANSVTGGSTITIDNASAIAKGIASFNSTNFSVSSGAVNTIQNIDISATPTFAGLTLSGFTTDGGLLYTNGSGLLAQTGAGSAGQCLTSNGSGAPTFTSCAAATGLTTYWTQTNGALYPNNSTVDFLIGGQSSASAKFAVLNINSGTPTASVSAGAAGGAFLTATGNLQTTTGQSLTLGGGNSGNVVVSGIGTGVVHAVGGALSTGLVTNAELQNSSITVNGGTGLGVTGSPVALGGVLTLSNTGVTSNIAGDGISVDNATGAVTITNTGVLSLTGTANQVNVTGATGDITLSLPQNIHTAATPTFAGLTLSGLSTNGGVVYTNGSGVLAQTAQGSAGQCLTSIGGGAPVWVDCSTGSTINSPFQALSGAIVPLNSTLDFLVGGQSSSSAKFAVLNVNSGTPTASVSAGLSGGAFLTAAGNLATTNEQTLTLGSADTGSIVLSGFGAGVVQTNASGVLSSSALNLAGGASYITGILPTANGGTGIDGSGAANGTLLIGNGTGYTLATLTAGTGISVTNGSGSISIASTQGNQDAFWNQANGSLFANNSTVDLLIGGQSSSSAKFAVLNVNSGTPIASISAGLAGGAFLSADGVLATTNEQSLTLGNSSTGQLILGNTGFGASTGNNAVLFGTSGVGVVSSATTNTDGLCLTSDTSGNPSWEACPGSGAGGSKWTLSGNVIYPNLVNQQVGVGTTTAGSVISSFYVTRDLASGALGKAVAIFNQTESQDLITASASGVTRFAVNNNGNLQFAGSTNFLTTLTSTTANDVTLTIPDTGTTDTICLVTLGNCAGTGTGITGSGTATQLAFFSGGSQNLASDANLYWDNTNKFLSLGAGASPLTTLHVAGGNTGGRAVAIFDQTGNAANDLITASASGVTKFIVSNGGNISLAGSASNASNYITAPNFSVTTGGVITAATTNTINGVSINAGAITGTNLNLTNNTNQLVLGTGNTGTITMAALSGAQTYTLPNASGTICLDSNNCGYALSANNLWQLNNNAISPANSTFDVLFGATATTSAKFAFLNNAGGTPTASISANSGNNASFLSGAGVLGTTNMQSLTLGNSSTGQIVLGGLGFGASTGNNAVLYGTSGNGVLASSTTSTAGLCLVSGASGPSWVSCADSTGLQSFWNQTNGALYPYNSTVDFLIGGQATTSALFAITGVNNGTPVATVSATTNGLGLSLTASTGTIQSLNMGTLTLGGSTTGNVVIDSGSGLITLADATSISSNLTVAGTTGIVLSGSGADLAFTGGGINTISSTGTLEIDAHTLTGAITGNGQNVTGLGALSAGGTITFGSFTTNGGLLYTNGSGVVAQLTAQGSLGDCLVSAGAGAAPAFSSCATAAGDDWDVANGAIFPKLSSTLDFLLGSSATASAEFAVTGINDGTPTATISATTNGNGISLTGSTSTIQSLRNNTLTLGGNTTGDINFFSGVNRLTSGGALTLAGTITANTTNTINGVSINAGAITGTNLNLTNNTNQLVLGTGNTGTITMAALSGAQTYTLPNASGTFCLDSNNCGYALSSNNFWQLNNNALSPANSTFDVLFGATATSSAKFAFLNNAGGTPVASISANSGNIATYLTGDGSLSTTNRQTLTIGNSSTYNTTGNILLNPNGTGNVGIGLTTPLAKLHLAGSNADLTSSQFIIQNSASGGRTAGLKFMGSTTGDSGMFNSGRIVGVFDGTTYGSGRITIQTPTGLDTWTDTLTAKNGLVGIGTNNPSEKLDVNGTATISGSLVVKGPNPWYDVKAYGARGDNTQDDTAAIQAAIDAASNGSTGSTVFIPQGKYRVTKLIVNKLIRIMGAGYDATFIVPTADEDVFSVNVGQAVQVNNVIIQDLGIYPATDRAAGAAIRFGYVGNSIIQNVRITNANGGRPYEGLRMDRASDVHIRDVRVAGAASNGVVLEPQGTDNVIVEVIFDENSIFNSNQGHGVYMVNTYGGSASLEGIHFISSTMYNNTGDGIRVNADGGQIRNIHLENAIADSNAGNGIYVEGSEEVDNFVVENTWSSFNTGYGIYLSANVVDWEISNGYVPTNGKNGIYVDGADRGRITGVALYSNSREAVCPSGYYGIELAGAASYITISNNRVYNSPNHSCVQNGVLISSSATNIELTDNYLDVDQGVAGTQTALTNNSTSSTNRLAGNVFNSTNDTAFAVGSGTTAPVGLFNVSGYSVGKALAVLNYTGTDQNIFTASASGATKFNITNTGNLQLTGNTNFLTTITSLTGNDVTLTIPDTGATDTFCLVTLANCTPAAAVNYWQMNNGAISPFSNTLDVLIGNTATTSAKFAFMNVAGGTPTASISANTGDNAAFLTGLGNLGTTNKQTLTLGSASTGLINVANGSGSTFATFDTVNSRFGIGTTAPAALISGISTAEQLRLGYDASNYFSTTVGSTGGVTFDATGAGAAFTFTDAVNINANAGLSIKYAGLEVLKTTKGAVGASSVGAFIDNKWDSGWVPLVVRGAAGQTASIFQLMDSSNTILTSVGATGNLGLGITAPTSELYVTRPLAFGVNGKALAVFDQIESQDIFTASSAGVTKFTINNNGNLQFAGSTSFLTTLTSAATAARTITFPDADGTICLQASSACGFTLSSNNYWQLNNNAVSPANSTFDVLFGATATSAAKFGFLNNAGGTPTASISANSGNIATYLTGDGTLGTTNRQTLTIGNSSTYNTTGNVLINPNGTGNVGIGTTTPLAKLHVSSAGQVALFGTTGNTDQFITVRTDGTGMGYFGLDASLNGGSGGYLLQTGSNKTLNFATGNDTFGAVSPMATLTTTGSFGIGTTSPTALLDVAGTASISGALKIYGTPQIQSTSNQTLTLGGNTTGDISLMPRNGLGFVGIGTATPARTLEIRQTNVGSNTELFLFNADNSNGASASKIRVLTGGASGGDAYATFEVNGVAGWSLGLDNSDSDKFKISSNVNNVGTSTALTIDSSLNIGIGTSSPISQFHVTRPLSSAVNGKALAIFDQIENQDILTASASGVTRFVVNNNGNLQFGGGQTALSTLTKSGATARTFTFPDADGTICLQNSASCGFATGSNYWQLNNNLLSPSNSTYDFAIGGTATSSSLFAITGVAAGTPTATISATTNGNGLSLNASTSTIQSLRNNTLTIGGDTTGSINLALASTEQLIVGGGVAAATAFTEIGSDATSGVLMAIGASSPVTLSNILIGQNINLSTNYTATNQSIYGSYINLPAVTNTHSSVAQLNGMVITGGAITHSSGTGTDQFNGLLIQNPTITQTSGTVEANAISVSTSSIATGGTQNGLNVDAGGVSNGTLNGVNISSITAGAGAERAISIGSGWDSEISFADSSVVLDGPGSSSLTFQDFTTFTASTLDTFTTAATLGLSATTLNLGAGSAATISTISDDNLSLSPNGTGDLRLVNDADSDIIMPFFTTNGGLLYANGSGVLAQTAAGSAGQCLTSIGGGTPVFATCGSGTNYWTSPSAGVLSPINSTLDVLIGGTATTSSKFAFMNVAGGTPTASISANSGNNATYLTGAGNLATTNKQTLTLGGASTGLVQVLNGAGSAFTTFDTVNSRIGIGTAAPESVLQIFAATPTLTVQDSSADTATLLLGTSNNPATITVGARLQGIRTNSPTSGSTDLNFSTSLGSTITEWMRLSSTGKLGLGTTSPTSELYVTRPLSFGATGKALAIFDQIENQDIFTASASGTTMFTIGNTGNLQFKGNTAFTTTLTSAATAAQTITFPDASGTICLQSSGSCGFGLGTNYFTSSNGAIYPINSTMDLLIGGTSTASAKFAFKNVLTGNPTIQIYDATGAQSMSLFHDGTNANITSTTGTINIGAGGGTLYLETAITNDTSTNNGYVQISDKLLVQGTETAGNALAVLNNLGAGDIFTASASGTSRFSLTSAGGIKLGTDEGTLDQCLLSGGAGAGATWSECPGGTGTTQWNIANGMIYSGNTTLDFALGGTATSTAKFAVINMNSGTPTASISANTGSNATFLTGLGNLGTTNKQTLTLGGASTGLVQVLNSAGSVFSTFDTLNSRLTVGTNPSSTGVLNISSANTSNTTIADFQINGTTVFNINSTRGLTLTAGGAGNGSIDNALTLGIKSAINVTSETVPVQFNAGTYTVTGNYATQRITNFSQPTITAASGVGITSQAINLNVNGAPISAGSAVIANSIALKIGAGTSVASGVTNAYGLYVDSPTGATNNYAATFATGRVGIGTVSPTSELHVTRALSQGALGKSLAIFDQIENQDIFTASASGTPRFTITNAGGISLGANGLFTGTAGQCLTSGGTGAAAGWSNCSSATNWWTTSSDGKALTPINSTMDFLLGGTASTSAKFAVLNVAGGTPVASISANSGNIATYLTGDGTIATTNRQTLTLGNSSAYNTTGNVLINPNGTGNVGIGLTTPLAKFHLAGSNADLTSSQFIVQNSASGGRTAGIKLMGSTTGDSNMFNNGRIFGVFDGTTYPTARLSLGTPTGNDTFVTVLSAKDTRLGIGTITTPISQLDVTRDITIAGVAATGKALVNFNQIENQDIFTASASGTPRFTVTSAGGIKLGADEGTLDQCLLSGGAGVAAVWEECPGGTGTTQWDITNGAIYSGNTTLDLLVGGNSTASAKFAFINNVGGTPVASISANNGNNALMLAGDGVIGTTNGQTLTFGGVGTGDIAFRPNGASAATMLLSGSSLSLGVNESSNGLIRLFSSGAGVTDPTISTNSTGELLLQGAAGDISFILGAAEGVIIDAATTDSTTVGGAVDLNVDTLTNNNVGFNLDYIIRDSAGISAYAAKHNITIDNDGSQNSTGYGLQINGDNDDAGSTLYGLYVDVNVDGDGAGTRYAGVFNNGLVGIGTTTPLTTLHVNGKDSAGRAAMIVDQTAASANDIFTASSSGTTHFTIANNGNVTVVGSATTCIIGNGVSATNCSSSDQRLKDDIADLNGQSGLSALKQLNPVTYQWNEFMQENGATNAKQFGFIAQEVANVFPNLIEQDINTGYYKLDYQGLFAPIVSSIQELAAKDDQLQSQIGGELSLDGQDIAVNSIEVNGGEATIDELGNITGKSISVDGQVTADSILVTNGLTAENVDAQELSAAIAVLGETTVESLNVTNDATISGTLFVDKIRANQIEGIEFFADLESNESFLSVNDKLASISAKIDFLEGLGLFNAQGLASGSGSLVALDNLMVSGSSTFADVAVLNNLTIGNMSIGSNSINTLGEDLEIQSLAQGDVKFFGGLISFDTEGNIEVSGNLAVAGDVTVGGVLSAQDVAVGRIDGIDIVSATEVTATGSSGLVSLVAGEVELKVNNDKVTADSLILVTPKTEADLPIYIKSQASGVFTVGIKEEQAGDIKFNFLIVSKAEDNPLSLN